MMNETYCSAIGEIGFAASVEKHVSRKWGVLGKSSCSRPHPKFAISSVDIHLLPSCRRDHAGLHHEYLTFGSLTGTKGHRIFGPMSSRTNPSSINCYSKRNMHSLGVCVCNQEECIEVWNYSKFPCRSCSQSIIEMASWLLRSSWSQYYKKLWAISTS